MRQNSAPARRGAGALAEKPILSPGGIRRAAAAAPDQRRKPGGVSLHRRACSRRHRVCRDGSPFQGAGHHRRDGLCLLVLGDGSRGGVWRRWCRRPRTACAAVGAGGEIRFAHAHRAHAGRDLSRARSRPAGAGRRHHAGRGRSDRIGALVQRLERLYAHFRYVAAGTGDPAAQRLCRCDHLGDPRPWRRCAQADR